MSTIKAPSMFLLRAFSPLLRSPSLPLAARGCLAQQQQQAQAQAQAQFSTTQPRQKRKKQGAKRDARITQIRYHLNHPLRLNPRPLRFSRTRYLRHWTIHRAWMRYQDILRQTRQLDLERQYNAMAAACEQLRLIDGEGLTAEQRLQLGQTENKGNGKEEGRLYRIAMMKKGVWNGVPIEYARIMTETPAKEGWNHGWTR